jgi:hypothetical protein
MALISARALSRLLTGVPLFATQSTRYRKVIASWFSMAGVTPNRGVADAPVWRERDGSIESEGQDGRDRTTAAAAETACATSRAAGCAGQAAETARTTADATQDTIGPRRLQGDVTW